MSVDGQVDGVRKELEKPPRDARLLLFWLPKQNDLRNFLMSEECAELAQMVANLG